MMVAYVDGGLLPSHRKQLDWWLHGNKTADPAQLQATHLQSSRKDRELSDSCIFSSEAQKLSWESAFSCSSLSLLPRRLQLKSHWSELVSSGTPSRKGTILIFDPSWPRLPTNSHCLGWTRCCQHMNKIWMSSRAMRTERAGSRT